MIIHGAAPDLPHLLNPMAGQIRHRDAGQICSMARWTTSAGSSKAGAASAIENTDEAASASADPAQTGPRQHRPATGLWSRTGWQSPALGGQRWRCRLRVAERRFRRRPLPALFRWFPAVFRCPCRYGDPPRQPDQGKRQDQRKRQGWDQGKCKPMSHRGNSFWSGGRASCSDGSTKRCAGPAPAFRARWWSSPSRRTEWRHQRRSAGSQSPCGCRPPPRLWCR